VPDRWVVVEGSSNVRDLGGLPLIGGGMTAYGVFYRSDTPQEWTEPDAQGWRMRRVGLVVDLRAPLEAEQEGRGPLVDRGDVRYLNAPLLPDRVVVRGHEELVVHDNSRAARVERYLAYLSDEGGGNLVRAVEALATSPMPALFHCAAGKDRTGVLAAFVLEVAGVEREATVADYGLTSERLPGILERLSRLSSYARDIAASDHDHHLAEPGTMRALLETIDTRTNQMESDLFDVRDRLGRVEDRVRDGFHSLKQELSILFSDIRATRKTQSRHDTMLAALRDERASIQQRLSALEG